MTPNNQSQPGAMNLAHIHQSGLNIIEFGCGAISRPIELILRPWHGTRYFALPVVALSMGLMLIVPALMAAFTAVVSMIPFTRIQAPIGMFGIGSFAVLFFALSLVHAVRLYKLMVHPAREAHSTYEGPPLPLFQFIPWCRSFHMTRIVFEPLLILVASVVMQDLLIIQSNLAIYLRVAALALAMKAFVGWYRSWEFVRGVLDAKNAGPIIAKLADDSASEEERASVNVATFPRDIPPDIRAEAVVSIARAYSGKD